MATILMHTLIYIWLGMAAAMLTVLQVSYNRSKHARTDKERVANGKPSTRRRQTVWPVHPRLDSRRSEHFQPVVSDVAHKGITSPFHHRVRLERPQEIEWRSFIVAVQPSRVISRVEYDRHSVDDIGR
jgi:hypothetical protein